MAPTIARLLATLLTTSALVSTSLAASFVVKQDGPYPYCTHVQSTNAPDGGAWPVILFLPGSGARGPASQAGSLCGYDGVGKLISQYNSGTKSGNQKIAAEQFLTVIPIGSLSSNQRHFQPDKLVEILEQVKAQYNVDEDRLYVTGYSMGSRGTFRFGVYKGDLVAALAPSAGGAEEAGSGTLQQESASATFPLLENLVGIPLRQFAGASDTTAGTTGPQKTQDRLEALGDTAASLTIMQGDHSTMSTAPWDKTDLLSWFLTKKRSDRGGSSSSSSSSSSNSTVVASSSAAASSAARASGSSTATASADEGTATQKAIAVSASPATATAAAASVVTVTTTDDCGRMVRVTRTRTSTPTPTATAAADEEDCDDEDESAAARVRRAVANGMMNRRAGESSRQLKERQAHHFWNEDTIFKREEDLPAVLRVKSRRSNIVPGHGRRGAGYKQAQH